MGNFGLTALPLTTVPAKHHLFTNGFTMKSIRYQTRKLRVRIRRRWMACRVAAAEKKRSTHDQVPAYLKDMWDSYLNFARLEF
jgi:hypothetical protein